MIDGRPRPDVDLSLRQVTQDDERFLRGLYASTRREEVERTGWTDPQKEAFINQQFQAQDRHYRQHYDPSTFYIILADGEPAGRLYLYRSPGDLRVVDISFLPEFRGHGLGTVLFERLFAEADAAGQKVSINVEFFNRARRLYERLGFVYRVEDGVYLLMEREPTVR